MPGNDLLIAGSGELANFLLKEGLIEEIRLLVYPIILGKGKRLFKDGTNQKLKLLSTREFSTGVAALHYEMAK
jgi:dihydrofolate reductase